MLSLEGAQQYISYSGSMGGNVAIKSTPVHIREAKHADLSAVLLLNHHLHEGEPLRERDEEISALWQDMLRDPRLFSFVAEFEGEVVGSCVLDIVPNMTRGARPFGVLQNVVTHRDYRGRGVGKQLNEFVLAFAWSRNCYQVLVQTGRPEVVAFYERLGFRQAKIGMVAKPAKPDGR